MHTGELDRARIAAAVFKDAGLRRKLNQATHVRASVARELACSGTHSTRKLHAVIHKAPGPVCGGARLDQVSAGTAHVVHFSLWYGMVGPVRPLAVTLVSVPALPPVKVARVGTYAVADTLMSTSV